MSTIIDALTFVGWCWLCWSAASTVGFLRNQMKKQWEQLDIVLANQKILHNAIIMVNKNVITHHEDLTSTLKPVDLPPLCFQQETLPPAPKEDDAIAGSIKS